MDISSNSNAQFTPPSRERSLENSLEAYIFKEFLRSGQSSSLGGGFHGGVGETQFSSYLQQLQADELAKSSQFDLQLGLDRFFENE